MRLRLFMLAVGTFAIGMDAFVTAGLVRPIADDLDVSVSAAGQLVTVFAASYAILSPILAALTARLSRRTVLLAALGLFVIGNVVTAVAPTYGLVLLSRVVAAAGAAMYTPNASAVAAALAPPERRGRAMATVIGGLTAATALGVPIGSWLGGAVSWRGTLWLVAALGAIALLGVVLRVPAVRLPMPTRLRDRLAPMANPQIATTLAHAVLLFTGSFTVYTYIAEVLAPATGGDTVRLTVVLWAYGIAAVVANLLGGRLSDTIGPRRLQLGALAAFAIILACAPLAAINFPGAIVWAALFGLPGWLWTPAQQHRLVSLAPQTTPIVLGLNASAQYLGIALAGIAGGLGLRLWGTDSIGWIGTGFVLAALAVATLAHRPNPAVAPAEPAQNTAEPARS